jgi:hypothetical protein
MSNAEEINASDEYMESNLLLCLSHFFHTLFLPSLHVQNTQSFSFSSLPQSLSLFCLKRNMQIANQMKYSFT